MPIARPRWFGGNASVRIAALLAKRKPEPTPCTSRKRISSSAPVLPCRGEPGQGVATAKIAKPRLYILTRPEPSRRAACRLGRAAPVRSAQPARRAGCSPSRSRECRAARLKGLPASPYHWPAPRGAGDSAVDCLRGQMVVLAPSASRIQWHEYRYWGVRAHGDRGAASTTNGAEFSLIPRR